MSKILLFTFILVNSMLCAKSPTLVGEEKFFTFNICDKLDNECLQDCYEVENECTKDCEETQTNDKNSQVCINKCEVQYEKCIDQHSKKTFE